MNSATLLAVLPERGRPANLETLLNAAEVAAYLGIGRKKVYGLPIAQVRLSDKRVRWLASDVNAYVRRNRRGI
jgi:predicted DNA-binding transcriptional regulator AlpA